MLFVPPIDGKVACLAFSRILVVSAIIPALHFTDLLPPFRGCVVAPTCSVDLFSVGDTSDFGCGALFGEICSMSFWVLTDEGKSLSPRCTV